MEHSDEWITWNRYPDMEVLEEEQPELVELPKKEAVLADPVPMKESKPHNKLDTTAMRL
jgi:hypothetical protein